MVYPPPITVFIWWKTSYKSCVYVLIYCKLKFFLVIFTLFSKDNSGRKLGPLKLNCCTCGKIIQILSFIENRMSDFWGVVVGAGGLDGNGCVELVWWEWESMRDVWGMWKGMWSGNVGCGGWGEGVPIPFHLSLFLIPFLFPPFVPSLPKRSEIRSKWKFYSRLSK